ncbi:MAG: hypothetical protein IPK26_19860 [Planctomycetes bacterium]|nr:hypothetical protein [Planctomycetota bacterium]
MVPPEIAWTIVDDLGQPVANATSTVGTLQLAADAQGRTGLRSDATEVAIVATAPWHTTVATTVTRHGDNLITLSRVCPLTVMAIDPADQPVRDVEVRIRRRDLGAPPGFSAPATTDVLQARTGADGLAVIADVVAGVWLLDAQHEQLVYSREAQARGADGYGGVAVFMPHLHVVTIRLVEPCVVAFEVDGGDILSSSCGNRRDGTHMPSNPDGYAALTAIQERLQALHPKAVLIVRLIDHSPIDPQTVNVQATVWVAGRRPWQGTVHPVLLRDFRAPTRIAVADMPVSDEFGSISVHFVSASGRQLADVRMQLMAADPKDPLAMFGNTPFLRNSAAQGLITLPVGTWKINPANPFLQLLADNLGPIQVARGSIREIRLGDGFDWARCRLSSNADSPHAGGGFTITHVDTGAKFTQMVTDFRDGLEMWLPTGKIRLEISGREIRRRGDSPRLVGGQSEGLIVAGAAGVQRLTAALTPR